MVIILGIAVGIILFLAGWFVFYSPMKNTDLRITVSAGMIVIALVLLLVCLFYGLFCVFYVFFGKEECSECGAEYKILYVPNYCADCGYNLNPECECGVPIKEDTKYCENCGKSLQQ